MAMGMKIKGSAAVLVAAVCVYFVVRTPRTESPRMAAVEPPAIDVELAEAADLTANVTEEVTANAAAAADPETEAGQRSPVADEPPEGASAVAGKKVLRVILEGITEEDARMATVTVKGVDERDGRPEEIQDSWPSQGLTSEFDLDPSLAVLADPHENLRVDELEVEFYHPQFLLERARVSLARGVEMANGKTLHELRVRLVRPEFWPEFTLVVRDAHTREHLEDVELRLAPGAGNALWGRNGTSTLLGDRLKSPIALMGGRAADEAEAKVAGVALLPAPGESPRLVGLNRRFPPERGVIVLARAPGYAWGSTSLDVSKGERELLLEPAATLDVRLTNVQLERYAALETVPTLCVYRHYPNGNLSYVRFERLDETLMTDGMRLESLVPAGNYAVAVELEGGAWTKRPVLAREELPLAAGQTRELVLALADPPAPPQRATLGGVVSIPAFGGEEEVRLQLYFQPTQRWRKPDVEFSLADLQRVGGALPTWSLRVEDLPVGMYRVQLLPFLKVWMIDLPAGGREDLELVLPELAEVLVETVDGQTGERVPLDQFYFRNQEPLPDQLQNDWARADTLEPGRFRFWTAPGTVRVWPRFPSGSDLEYGGTGQDFELVPGLQSVRFELAPVYAMHFEFREGGVALPVGDPGMYVMQNIRAVGHEGRVTGDGLQTDMRVGVSAPGLYEISFVGIDADRYHPIPPRRVDVRAGEPAEVIVELRRK